MTSKIVKNNNNLKTVVLGNNIKTIEVHTDCKVKEFTSIREMNSYLRDKYTNKKYHVSSEQTKDYYFYRIYKGELWDLNEKELLIYVKTQM